MTYHYTAGHIAFSKHVNEPELWTLNPTTLHDQKPLWKNPSFMIIVLVTGVCAPVLVLGAWVVGLWVINWRCLTNLEGCKWNSHPGVYLVIFELCYYHFITMSFIFN